MGQPSQDGDVVTYLEIRLQGDDASHIEDDDSLTRLDSLSEIAVPLSLRLVTCTTLPPLPPVTYLP